MVRVDWAFDQPRSCAVITLRQIMKGWQPVLHVTHDADDHGWQFLGWDGPSEEDAVVVCFEEVVNVDPTLLQLADLPPGWHAWRRSPQEPWLLEPNPCEKSGPKPNQ
jgi:hypothetical protein